MNLISYRLLHESAYSERIWFTTYANAQSFFGDIIDGTVSGYSLTGLLNNDSDYVVKGIYYPIKIDGFISTGGSTSTHIIVGKKITSTDADLISGMDAYQSICSFTITRQHNNFLDFAPYTKMTFHFPYFDDIELPLERIYGKQVIVYLGADLVNNKFTLYLATDSGSTIIATQTGTIGIELSLGKTNAQEMDRNNVLQTFSGVMSLLGLGVGTASGNPLVTVGSVGMLNKTVTNAVNNNVNHLKSYHTGNGNRSSLAQDTNIYIIRETVTDIRYPNYSIKGGVCKQNLSLSSVTGYTEIGEIHFNPSDNVIYDDEISEIIDLLHTGVIL